MTEPKSTAVTPADVLPDGVDHTVLDGVTVRKGSVAAFVANAKILATLTPDSAEYRSVVTELAGLVPALRVVGVLDVFEPRSELVRGIVDGA